MARMDRKGANALLAFGQRVAPEDAFEDFVAARGWKMNGWAPTFIEPTECEPPGVATPRQPSHRDHPWHTKQVLCPAAPPGDGAMRPPADIEPRLMVAPAGELPTLYYVQWHYIDFVLSCVGNLSEAARVLGIRRSTVQRKRKKTPPAR
jgi:hypothetical protein